MNINSWEDGGQEGRMLSQFTQKQQSSVNLYYLFIAECNRYNGKSKIRTLQQKKNHYIIGDETHQ